MQKTERQKQTKGTQAQPHLPFSSSGNLLMQLQSNTSKDLYASVAQYYYRFGATVLCPVGAPPAAFSFFELKLSEERVEGWKKR